MNGEKVFYVTLSSDIQGDQITVVVNVGRLVSSGNRFHCVWNGSGMEFPGRFFTTRQEALSYAERQMMRLQSGGKKTNVQDNTENKS